jgi:hypothetical protein
MPNVNEEYALFVRRCLQFHHVWTIYFDLLSGRYIPSVENRKFEDLEPSPALIGEMVPTVMFILFAFFYSLIEDSDDALDGFRIWRQKYPEEEAAIAALEQQTAPLRDDLKVFRNRLGFHGSRTQKHESSGYDLFGNHSGLKVLETMKTFKMLNAALIAKDLARQNDSAKEMATARALLDSIPSRCRQLVGI